MTRIYTVMVADLFHYGHVDFLRRARLLGDYLVVGLLTDECVADYKREPILTWSERKPVVESCKYVDEVWPHSSHGVTDEFMIRYGFELKVYACASESENREHLQLHHQRLDPRYVRRIDYTDGISTSEIILRVQQRGDLAEEST